MLTGDKGETAIQIGKSCGLYDVKTMKLLEVTESDDEATLIRSLGAHKLNVQDAQDGVKFAMAVAGNSLPMIYRSQEL